MIEIKSRWDGSILYTAENAQDVRVAMIEAVANGADLRGADLRGADLRGAYLCGAYLRGADLCGAYLRGADLRSADLRSADLRSADLRSAYLCGADLRGADLRGADLRGADLRSANGVVPERCTDLLMLLDQVGKIRAYKLTTADGCGPTFRGLTYEVGKTVTARVANTDPDQHCGAGVNLATLPWCLSHWEPGYRIFVVEFGRADIAAIPTATDGKFRVSKCRVVREIPEDTIKSWVNFPCE